MAVPLHNELTRKRGTALADRDCKGRRADGAGQRSGKGEAARRGGRRPHEEADGRGGRLGFGSLTDQKDRPSRLLGTAAETPGCGEVEPFGIAAQLDEQGGKPRKRRGLLGNPQQVGELRHLGKQEILRGNAELMDKAGRVGKARFPENLRRADPQQRQALAGGLEDQAGERQHEPRRHSCITGLGAMDLGERCLGQAAAERTVQPFRPGRNECSLTLSRTAMT